MHTWRTQMPEGMRLKCDGFACSLFDSKSEFTLGEYCERRCGPYADVGMPDELDMFSESGMEFRRRGIRARLGRSPSPSWSGGASGCSWASHPFPRSATAATAVAAADAFADDWPRVWLEAYVLLSFAAGVSQASRNTPARSGS